MTEPTLTANPNPAPAAAAGRSRRWPAWLLGAAVAFGAGLAWQSGTGPPRGGNGPDVAQARLPEEARPLFPAATPPPSSITVAHPPVTLVLPGEVAPHVDADSLAAVLAERLRGMAQRIGLDPVPAVTVVVHADFASRGMATRSMLADDAHPERDEVRRVWCAADPAGDGLGEAALLLRHRFGAISPALLEAGAQVWLAGRWLGAPLPEWPGRLAALGRPAEAAFWLGPDGFVAESYWFSWPAAGVIVEALVARGGVPALERLITAGRVDMTPVERELAALPWPTAVAGAEGIPRRACYRFPKGLDPLRTRGDGFDRGICYAHGHGLDHGYASLESGANLAYLRDSVAVNAVAINPFGYIRGATDPRIAHPYRFRGRGRLGEEDDESLLTATAQAHALGLKVMMAPHLWGRVWCGDWHAEDEAGWELLFAEYRRFILHYAAVAQYAGCDLLQIGKELGGTSHREREWRELVLETRRVFTGPILYDANWNLEYEQLTWWDAVDLIGVSQYTPLSTAEAPDDAELRNGARGVADRLDAVARRFGRRYLLAEVGFTAEVGAAANPWVESDGRTPDLALQARCYEAILETFGRRPLCAGVYWWKWFSALESNNRGGNRHDFPPYGKPAEEVLERWYRRLERERG